MHQLARRGGFVAHGLGLADRETGGLVDVREQAAELVVEDGVTGVLTPPGDVDALVTALEPLMREPASAAGMGARGRARAVETFSLGAEASRIAEVYRRLV